MWYEAERKRRPQGKVAMEMDPSINLNAETEGEKGEQVETEGEKGE